MSKQTPKEAEQIMQYWIDHYAQGLLDIKFNGQELCEEVRRRGYTELTFENLEEARVALGDAASGGVLLYPPKIVVVEKVVQLPPPPPKRIQLVQSEHNRDNATHAAREGARRDQEQKVTLVANDVNSPVFQRENEKQRRVFEDLISRGGIVQTPWGKLDATRTQNRTEELREIAVYARQDDASGKPVKLYSQMVKIAQELVRKWEKEDSRRGW